MLTFPRQTIREGQRFSNFIHEAGTSIIDRCVDIHGQPLIQRVSEPDRDVILPTARLLRDRVVTLAAGDALEGGTRHRRRALKELLAVCAFEDWNPAHFLDTAEMLAAVALGLLWCRSLATPAEQSRLDAAITAKGLQPGAEAFARGDFWVSATHNWNTVCCGALVLGALSLRHGTRRRVADLHPVFAPALAGLRNGFSAFGDDGGYAEGVAYWALAMRAALLAESALLAAGFSDGLPPHLAAGWRFSRDMLAPSGRPFDFGDTPPDWERPDCLGLLASLAADPEAARWHREAPGAPTGLDLLWPGPPHRGNRHSPAPEPPRPAPSPGMARLAPASCARVTGGWGSRVDATTSTTPISTSGHSFWNGAASVSPSTPVAIPMRCRAISTTGSVSPISVRGRGLTTFWFSEAGTKVSTPPRSLRRRRRQARRWP